MDPPDNVEVIPMTGAKAEALGLSVRVPKCMWRLVNVHRWHLHENGGIQYAKTTIDGKGVSLHRFVYGELVKMGRKPAPTQEQKHIDHINGDGLDNSEENLQAITPSGNSQKKRKPVIIAERVSAYRGVHANSVLTTPWLWRACYKGACLGISEDPFVCACWYDHAIFRENKGGVTNFPSPNPSHPLSSDAIANLDKIEAQPKLKNAGIGITKLSHGMYTVNIRRKNVGTFQTHEEAVIFRDMAQTEGVPAAKHTRKQIYSSKPKRFPVYVDGKFVWACVSEAEADIFAEIIQDEGCDVAKQIAREIYTVKQEQQIQPYSLTADGVHVCDVVSWGEAVIFGEMVRDEGCDAARALAQSIYY